MPLISQPDIYERYKYTAVPLPAWFTALGKSIDSGHFGKEENHRIAKY